MMNLLRRALVAAAASAAAAPALVLAAANVEAPAHAFTVSAKLEASGSRVSGFGSTQKSSADNTTRAVASLSAA